MVLCHLTLYMRTGFFSSDKQGIQVIVIFIQSLMPLNRTDRKSVIVLCIFSALFIAQKVCLQTWIYHQPVQIRDTCMNPNVHFEILF